MALPPGIVIGGVAAIRGAAAPAGENVLPWILCPLPGVALWQQLLYVFAFLPGKLAWERLLAAAAVAGGAEAHAPRPAAGGAREPERFSGGDLAYLCVNNFTEMTLVLHAAAFAAGPSVCKVLQAASAANTAAALALCFWGFDAAYAPWHALMHQRRLYPYVHKHHHKRTAPCLGWYHTGSMTPVEHCTTLLILLLVPRAVARVTGLHLAAYALYMLLWYSLEVLNHMPYNVVLAPLGYAAAAHQVHHRHPCCNYGTLSSAADQIAGTFRDHRVVAL